MIFSLVVAASPLPGPSASPTGPAPTVPFGDTVTSTIGLTKRQIEACGAVPAKLCLRIFDATGSTTLAGLSDLFVHGYHIVVIIAVAFLLRAVARRAIGRVTRSTVRGRDRVHRGLDRLDAISRIDARGLLDNDPQSVERRSQRAETIGAVLRSITNAVIFTLALVLVLGELGLNLAPIIASAGIVGVAVGFGAQSVVKDFLSGIFLVVEDQYGVGDVIDLGPTVKVVGVVESIGLRSTRVRDVKGNLWHIRNGDVSQVGNISQGWSRIVLDVLLAHGADVAAARAALLAAAGSVTAEEQFADAVLEPAAVWGVEDVTLDGVSLRLVVKVRAAVKDDIARLLRERLLGTLAEAGVPVARASRDLAVPDGGAGG